MVEKLKREAARRAFYHWKICIHSGLKVKIVTVEGDPVAMGYCRNKERDIDFEVECPDCKKHRITRRPPQHERTPTRKARISTGRRRSLAKKKALNDLKFNR